MYCISFVNLKYQFAEGNIYSCLITKVQQKSSLFCLTCNDNQTIVLEQLDESNEIWNTYQLDTDQPNFLYCTNTLQGVSAKNKALLYLTQAEDDRIWLYKQVERRSQSFMAKIDLKLKKIIEINYAPDGPGEVYWGAVTQIPYKYVEKHC